MFKFKGIRAFYFISGLMLVFQMFKLMKIVRSVEIAGFVALCLTIGLTIKLVIFDKKLRDLKCGILIAFLLVQEIVIGLDKIISVENYNIVILYTLLLGIVVLYCLDAPSVRRKMDEDAYVLKNANTMLTLTCAFSLAEIIVGILSPDFFI